MSPNSLSEFYFFVRSSSAFDKYCVAKQIIPCCMCLLSSRLGKMQWKRNEKNKWILLSANIDKYHMCHIRRTFFGVIFPVWRSFFFCSFSLKFHSLISHKAKSFPNSFSAVDFPFENMWSKSIDRTSREFHHFRKLFFVLSILILFVQTKT